MPIETGSMPSLLNGVSQQPAAVRSPSQASVQINALSSVSSGLQKRPPRRHVAKLNSDDVGDAFVHTIHRDDVEQYEVIIDDSGTLRVYHILTGNERTVDFPDGTGYLDATPARSGYSAITIADFTFIVNRERTVAMEVTTASGSLTGTVQTFADLPSSPTSGDIYRVQGDPSNAFDDFYTKFDGNVWVETVKPGVKTTLDAATMPHQLVRNADGTFTFSRVSWQTRVVGDASSAPEPTFVGQKITDVFFFRNRLGFSADEHIIFSAFDEFFRFWPETVTAILDTDPIDLRAPHERISRINYAVAFEEILLAFSQQAQFSVAGADVFTPRTAQITPTTEFEAAPNAPAVGIGTDVYFAANRGKFSEFREYFVDPEVQSADAANITGHVPTFIPSGVFRLSKGPGDDILLVLSTGKMNRVYVYKFFWDGDDKVQSSWSFWEWDAADKILHVSEINSIIYFVVQRADGIHLEKLEFNENDPTFDDLGIVVHLDRRVTLAGGTFDSNTDKTTWTLPYADSDPMDVILSSDFTGQGGEKIVATRPTDTTVEADGDLSTGNVYIGKRYEMRYEFSEQFPRRGRADNETADLSGRLQLRRFSVRYVDSGFFKAVVTPRARSPKEFTFTGRLAGTTKAGEVPTLTGTFTFTVNGQSATTKVEMVNDSFMPSTFLAVQWSGLHAPLGRQR